MAVHFVARTGIFVGCEGGTMRTENDDGIATPDSDDIRRRIIELQLEHRDLDVAIDRLSERSGTDELQLRRLKKRKLIIRDAMTRLEMVLVPDIPA
jgi:hypothetical protein